MLTLPEHLISPRVFNEINVSLSFVPPYFMDLSCLLDFEFCKFLLFNFVVSLYVYLVSNDTSEFINRKRLC